MSTPNRFKSGLIVWIAVLMLTTILAACSGNNSSNSSSGSTGNSSSAPERQETASSSAAEQAEPGVIDPNEKVTFDVFFGIPGGNSTWTGEIPEEITRRTGVSFDVRWATDANELSLMIASGELPEVIVLNSADPNLERLSSPEFSYAYNDLIEQYTPDFEISEAYRAINTATDGNMYTMKTNFSDPEEYAKYENSADGNQRVIALRQDIMEELGNPPLKSTDDLLNVFGMVKENYPAITPIVFSNEPSWTHVFKWIAAQFGAGDRGMIRLDDGNIVHYINQPNILNAYLFMNTLYREGYMLPENLVWTNNEDLAMIGQDKAFSSPGGIGIEAYFNDTLVKDGDGQGVWVMATELFNDTYKVFNYPGAGSTAMITKENKNPKKWIQFMQWAKSDEGMKLLAWGIEGKHWDWNPEDGGYMQLRPEYDYKTDRDLYVRENFNVYGFFISNSKVIDNLWRYVPGYDGNIINKTIADKFTVTDTIMPTISLNPDGDEARISAELTNMISNERIKVVLAETEQEAIQNFNEILQKAKQIGVEKLEKYYNEQYALKAQK